MTPESETFAPPPPPAVAMTINNFQFWQADPGGVVLHVVADTMIDAAMTMHVFGTSQPDPVAPSVRARIVRRAAGVNAMSSWLSPKLRNWPISALIWLSPRTAQVRNISSMGGGSVSREVLRMIARACSGKWVDAPIRTIASIRSGWRAAR